MSDKFPGGRGLPCTFLVDGFQTLAHTCLTHHAQLQFHDPTLE